MNTKWFQTQGATGLAYQYGTLQRLEEAVAVPSTCARWCEKEWVNPYPGRLVDCARPGRLGELRLPQTRRWYSVGEEDRGVARRRGEKARVTKPETKNKNPTGDRAHKAGDCP